MRLILDPAWSTIAAHIGALNWAMFAICWGTPLDERLAYLASAAGTL